jgi:hypothetical protein
MVKLIRLCALLLILELGIRAKVHGLIRLTRSPHGLETIFLSVYIFAHLGWTVKIMGCVG